MRLSYLNTPYSAEPTDGVVAPFEANLTGKFRGAPGKTHRLTPPQIAAAPTRSYYNLVCGRSL